jgi:hypothetical protein
MFGFVCHRPSAPQAAIVRNSSSNAVPVSLITELSDVLSNYLWVNGRLDLSSDKPKRGETKNEFSDIHCQKGAYNIQVSDAKNYNAD